MFTEKQINNFWKNVDVRDSNACWNWKRSVDHGGYGKTKILGTMYGSHRVAYRIKYGDIPDGKHVLHMCDNPACCNPSHLKTGSHSENMQDMKARGRMGVFGKPIIKMNMDLANQLRFDYKTGLSKNSLSKKYNISCRHIRDIVRNKCWKTA